MVPITIKLAMFLLSLYDWYTKNEPLKTDALNIITVSNHIPAPYPLTY